ncbi:family 78 glycoside hydrolase catalytic domain [Streptomyces stelliscabiei]|uniref:family 78 glycoside hydrolase catalytic domain n=1 Tax=Streptomyces stelliscabiei TaxID=146820 RepID=UPI002FF0E12C
MTSILRGARATDEYTLAGGSLELEPEFTFHGFRYAEIDASPGVTVESVDVVVVASDLRRIGDFQCSDERVNTLYSNVVRSQRGNFLAVPTDCPQRDERLGWTGDLMAFAPTACATFDSGAFLDSWLTDLRIEQRDDGAVPLVIPTSRSVNCPRPNCRRPVAPQAGATPPPSYRPPSSTPMAGAADWAVTTRRCVRGSSSPSTI